MKNPKLLSHESKIKALTQVVSQINRVGQSYLNDPGVQAELAALFFFIGDRIAAIKKESNVKPFV